MNVREFQMKPVYNCTHTSSALRNWFAVEGERPVAEELSSALKVQRVERSFPWFSTQPLA